MSDKHQNGVDILAWTAFITFAAVAVMAALNSVYGLQPETVMEVAAGLVLGALSWLWAVFLEAVSSGLFWSGLALVSYVGWKMRGGE